jgi:hypothetical protein
MQGDFCDEEIAHWRRVAGSLHRARMDIVDTIAQRDVAGAVQLVRDYHRKVIKHTQFSPRATKLRDADPGLTTMLSAWLAANVGVSSGLDRMG